MVKNNVSDTESQNESLECSGPPDELFAKLQDRAAQYYQYLTQTRYVNAIDNSRNSFFRPLFHMGNVLRFGDKSQYLDVSVNVYRNLVQHAVSQLLKTKLSYVVRTVNYSAESQKQSMIARSVLSYYTGRTEAQRVMYKATRNAFLDADSFIIGDWNFMKGEPLFVNLDGAVVMSGEPEFFEATPLEVVRPLVKDYNLPWVRVFRKMLKSDLKKCFPAFESEINNSSAIDESAKIFNYRENQFLRVQPAALEDYAGVFMFIARPSPECPQGRKVLFLQDGTALVDMALAAGDFPVYRIIMDENCEFPLPTSYAWDTLPLQSLIDKLMSIVSTNNAASGLQILLLPDGANISETALETGLAAIRYKGDKIPSTLQLTKSAPETYNLISSLKAYMENLLGLGVLQGAGQSAIKASGQALAILQSIDLQFSSNLQENIFRVQENMGNSLLAFLQTYATSPRVAELTGTPEQDVQLVFSANDLQNIGRVQVQPGNPLLNQLDGNYELATTIVNQGLVKSVDELAEVFTTGSVGSATEDVQNSEILIRFENEQMRKGVEMIVLGTDNHLTHIPQHMGLLDDPTVRNNPALVQLVNMHIEKHLASAQNLPPLIAMMRGIPPPLPPGTEGEVQASSSGERKVEVKKEGEN